MGALAICGLCLATAGARAQSALLDDRLVKVTDAAKVEATRAAMARHIWGTSGSSVLSRKPNSVDRKYSPTDLDALPANLANLARIDRLDVTTTAQIGAGGARSVESNAFVFNPAGSPTGAVILHHGHGCALDGVGGNYGLDASIRQLLSANFIVVGMRMPLFQRPTACSGRNLKETHNQLFGIKLQSGTALQFFLEPVARVVNYLSEAHPQLPIDMVGLSGGGWTATVYPALDARVRLSIPVAGSMPLYLRAGGSVGDHEQTVKEFYAIAGYKDLYILGSAGSGTRKQIQVLNRRDDCCFGERQHKGLAFGTPSYDQAIKEYEREIQGVLAKLDRCAVFRVAIDDVAQTHQISAHALSTVILPALAAPARACPRPS